MERPGAIQPPPTKLTKTRTRGALGLLLQECGHHCINAVRQHTYKANHNLYLYLQAQHQSPPLIIADSVKSMPSACPLKSTSTVPAPASKTPSKDVTLLKKPSSGSGSGAYSGRNTPALTSPPPNLLPTWANTFHTLPQSLPSSFSAAPSKAFRLGHAVGSLLSGCFP
ncbi:hypothetical protein H0H87_005585 [Tephrocybe sp. NHM501043]|nr:hypothetical protein H0H87_005585 [Tephrocybe sp. NHM501043]